MLYYIFRFLEQFNIPGSHIWSYISFRALLALIMSLLISAWFGEYFIKWMKRRNISETARDPSIDPFGVEKKGVPTMGGIIIIVSILVPVILLGRMRNIYLLLMIATTVWLGFLGFMDDYIKIFRKNKDGLKGRYKIVGQLSIGFIVGLTLWLSPDAVVRENVSVPQQNKEVVIKHQPEAVKSLKTTIPFLKNHNLNYSDVMSFCGKYKVAAGWVLFVLMTIFVVTAVSNGACCVVGNQAYEIKKGSRMANNSAIASMGYGLPAAIGTCLGAGRKETICLEGDGSIMMNLQELQTIITNRLPIKIYLINNSGYHSIRITQSNLFSEHSKVGIGPESGDLSFPEFKKIAEAFGYKYFEAHSNKEMMETIDKVNGMEGPVFVEIFTDTVQRWEPKSSAKKLPDGTLVSPPLEDLAPFLPREELEKIMIVPMVDEV